MTEDNPIPVEKMLNILQDKYEAECKAHEQTKQNLAFTEQQLSFTLQLFLKVAREFTVLAKTLNSSSTQLFNTADLITMSYNQIAKELENRQKSQDQRQPESPVKGEISP